MEVVHRETGLFVEERDVDVMVDYMIKLLENPKQAEKWSGRVEKESSNILQLK